MKIVEWLKTHWFLFTALVAAGVAWGQNTTKIIELEKTIDRQRESSLQVERLDERTILMLEELKTQRILLTEILRSQQEIKREVRAETTNGTR